MTFFAALFFQLEQFLERAVRNFRFETGELSEDFI